MPPKRPNSGQSPEKPPAYWTCGVCFCVEDLIECDNDKCKRAFCPSCAGYSHAEDAPDPWCCPICRLLRCHYPLIMPHTLPAAEVWTLEHEAQSPRPWKQDPPKEGFVQVSSDHEPIPRFAKAHLSWCFMSGKVEVRYSRDIQAGYKCEAWSVDDKRIWHGRNEKGAWTAVGEACKNLYSPKVLEVQQAPEREPFREQLRENKAIERLWKQLLQAPQDADCHTAPGEECLLHIPSLADVQSHYKYYCPFACHNDKGDPSCFKNRYTVEKHLLQSHMAEFREYGDGSLRILYAEPQVFTYSRTRQPCVVLLPLHSKTSSVVDLAKRARAMAERSPTPSEPSDDRSSEEITPPRKRARTSNGDPCHPFFAYLMANQDVPVAKRQGTSLNAVVPWIISEFMLPRWQCRNPHGPPLEYPLTEATFKAVLMSRGGGFKWAGKEGTYRKKDPDTGLQCMNQQGYLMPRGPLAWEQLLDECYTNWGKVFRHAHPGYVSAPEPLQVKPTDPRVISPSLPGGSPNAASPSKTMPPTSSSPKLSSEASQATPLDPRLNHPHHQPAAAAAAASPWAHHQHALGGGCTAESPGQRSRGAGRQSEPTTVDAAGSDAGASSSEEESRQLQHGSAADTSPAHNASRIQPGDPQLHPKPGEKQHTAHHDDAEPQVDVFLSSESAESRGRSTSSADENVAQELKLCRSKLEQLRQEEAAAQASSEQLKLEQHTAASSVKLSYSKVWELHSQIGPICAAWKKLEAYIEGLPLYNVGEDAELQQPAHNAVKLMREQTLVVLEQRLRAEAGQAFPDVLAACKALDEAEAGWQGTNRHQENLWAQEKEGQMLLLQLTRLRKPLEQKKMELEAVTTTPLHQMTTGLAS
ncbi:hypothetical protein WJX74_004256 [Apatococcus lobatus]|uniref:Uncharacterized protein n=1 Tax=Apatococcus lobatus TaxID=904363 RepID=A0AAW1QHL9_9CHLO